MKNIINLMGIYGTVTVDMDEIGVDCTTESNYTNCVNQFVNMGYTVNSVDNSDGVTTFVINDILIQISAPYGDDI